MFAGKKSAQIREILISESAWEEMTCLFAPSLVNSAERKKAALLAVGKSTIILWQSELLLGGGREKDKTSLVQWMGYI
ncbi:hypothetical protein HJ589_13885 [Escherichia coli]|nr:tail fiber assembly protein [Escherichia coli]EIM2794487.1 tail fiber assembly protein [Escherichia coli]MEB7284070.1 tail fiber assembly protein [Escherichia coli]QTP51477.1 hypothetical protein HJ589_13885 [Escherichia coli]